MAALILNCPVSSMFFYDFSFGRIIFNRFKPFAIQ